MARYFKRPGSDQIEDVDSFQVLAILFLGFPDLRLAGLWRHLFIWMVVIALSFIAGPPWMAILSAGLPIIYCFLIRKIVADESLKKGWVEVADPKLTLKVVSPASESPAA